MGADAGPHGAAVATSAVDLVDKCPMTKYQYRLTRHPNYMWEVQPLGPCPPMDSRRKRECELEPWILEALSWLEIAGIGVHTSVGCKESTNEYLLCGSP